MSAKNKLRVLSLICLYPMISTFLMTLIWQIVQRYVDPFLGGYYFKWVFLYTENNPDWLSDTYLPTTRILYFIYLASYVILTALTLLAVCRRRGKAVCTWCICGLWVADGVWVILDLAMSGIKWQSFILLAEHLIFIAWAVIFSVVYLRLKKTDPELFRKKKHRRNVYRRRFQ